MYKHSKENINLLQKLKQFNGEEQYCCHLLLWYMTRSKRITGVASVRSSTSGMTCLRRGKNFTTLATSAREMRLYERNRPAGTQVSEGGKGEGTKYPSRDSLKPLEKTMVRLLSHCSPYRSMVEQRSSCRWWRTPCQSRMLWRRLWPLGKHALEQAPGRNCGPIGRARNSHWSRFVGRNCDPAPEHRSSLFLKDCILWRGPTLEQFM